MIIIKKGNIALIALAAVLLLTGSFFAGVYVGSTPGKLDIISWLIEEEFALEYDEKAVTDFAAKGMVYALEDPYSEYLTAEESEIFHEIVSGQYKGIGVTLSVNAETENIYVVEVEKNGPAYRSGVKAGDVLISVDGIKVDLENYDRITYYIKGISEDAPEDDVEMKMKVLREGKELEFSLKREELEYTYVESEMMEDILYKKLSEFSEKAPEKINETLKENEGFAGIILDLRDNGGGELNSLIGIAEQILPEGLLLTTENAKGEKTEFKVKDNEYYNVPLAVLVNENTASASEVLAAAVKETNRGYLIGVTTYGKGLVQGIIPLGDGSHLKLTVEKYYTAGGNYINGRGITPNIVIEDSDEQLSKAIEYVKGEIK